MKKYIKQFSKLIVSENKQLAEVSNKSVLLKEIETKMKIADPDRKARALKIFSNFEEKELSDMIKYDIFSSSVDDLVAENIDNTFIRSHGIFNKYIEKIVDQGKQDELFWEQGLEIKRHKDEFFVSMGIDYGKFRKYADREYEVDVVHEKTRDLFEKQRVVDQMQQENKEKIDSMLNFYAGVVKKSVHNKYAYLIYVSTYSIKEFSHIQIRHFMTIVISAAVMLLLKPIALAALVPEMYGFVRASFFLSGVCNKIVLNSDKCSFKIQTYGLFGHERTDYRPTSFSVNDVYYHGVITNEFINSQDFAWSFIGRLLTRKPKANDGFRKFHKFEVNSRTFYIPADSSTRHEDTNETLLLNILNADLSQLLDFDYSPYEATQESRLREFYSWLKDYYKKNHMHYVTPEEKEKQMFQKFWANRDFSDEFYSVTHVEVDKKEGTYVNNGYR